MPKSPEERHYLHYWAGEIRSSILGNYRRMHSSEKVYEVVDDAEAMEELDAFNRIVELAAIGPPINQKKAANQK